MAEETFAEKQLRRLKEEHPEFYRPQSGKERLAEHYRRANRETGLIIGFYLGVAIPVSVGLSYLMAKAGHPNAYWLWHTILGVL